MRLKSKTQYGDMKGSTTADRHDTRDIHQFLIEKGLIDEGDIVVGIDAYSGEVHKKRQDEPLDVTILVSKASRVFATIPDELAETGTLKVEKIDTQIPLNEFFGLFKRFSLTLSSKGNLEGVEFTILNEQD